MKTKDLNRHVCSITGKGMSEGFLFCDDTYIKDEKDALEYAQKNGHSTLKKSYDAEFHYWTTWEDHEDLESEGEAFDDEGTLYTFTNGKWVQKINPNDLEHYDSGDGVSHEYWQHKETKDVFKVPIEIVRDWDNSELQPETK